MKGDPLRYCCCCCGCCSSCSSRSVGCCCRCCFCCSSTGAAREAAGAGTAAQSRSSDRPVGLEKHIEGAPLAWSQCCRGCICCCCCRCSISVNHAENAASLASACHRSGQATAAVVPPFAPVPAAVPDVSRSNCLSLNSAAAANLPAKTEVHGLISEAPCSCCCCCCWRSRARSCCCCTFSYSVTRASGLAACAATSWCSCCRSCSNCCCCCCSLTSRGPSVKPPSIPCLFSAAI